MDNDLNIVNLAHELQSVRYAAKRLNLKWQDVRAKCKKRRPSSDIIKTPAAYESPSYSDPITVVWFTDAHNQPGISPDRFIWLGNFVNELCPDVLIDGGDFDDMRSLCGHEGNETYNGKFKPSFMDDLSASKKARDLINKTIRVPVTKYHLLGNHEDRLWQFENRHPEVYGMMQHAYLEIQQNAGWDVRRYREYLTIGGVDFTHIPMNGLNKPVGGAQCCINVARSSIKDVCFGHTHSYAYWEMSKMGPGRSVVAINGGCYMPDGYVPDYSKGSQKAMAYGCHAMIIEDGHITNHSFVSMKEMAQRYSQ